MRKPFRRRHIGLSFLLHETKKNREKLKKEGLDVKLVQLDVTDPDSIKTARDVIEKAEGKLDVLVNNAGIPI